MRHRLFLAVAVLALGLAAPAHAAPPANDNFESPQTLTTGVAATGSTSQASAQAGEPDHAAFMYTGKSVWFRWTAPTTGVARIHSCGSYFDTTLAVYGGSTLTGLYATRKANNTDGCGQWWNGTDEEANHYASVVFARVVAGTSYRIALDGGTSSYYGGTYRIVAEMVGGAAPAPANDDFASATAVTGAEVRATGTTVGASSGWDEWSSALGQSVWWKWTSTVDGPVDIDTCGSTANTQISVARRADGEWAGGSDTATDCPSPGQFRIQARVGEEYFIGVGSGHNAPGAVKLHISGRDDTTPPVSTISEGPSGAHARRVATFLFDGKDDSGSGAATECSWDGGEWQRCYVKDERGSLADGEHTFRVRSTDRYGNVETAPAERRFTVSIPEAPNDDFADAAELIHSVAVTTNNTRATAEVGEPAHYHEYATDASRAFRSVWFRFTADASRRINLDWCASSVKAVMATYTGSSVGALTRVDGEEDGRCESDLYVRAGTTYHVALDLWESGDWGAGPLSLTLTNDGPPEPETTITSGPPAFQRDPGDAVFTFESSAPNATFMCQLAYQDAAPCTSPARFPVAYTFGHHALEVWSIDANGVADQTRARYRWTVDPRPTISGVTRAGQTLTAAYHYSSFAHQWLRCDSGGWNCVPVGSGLRTYVLKAEDTGHRMRVRVTDESGNWPSSQSHPTAVIGPPVATAPPAISGVTRAGQKLSASTGTWSPAATSYAYRWSRCDKDGWNCAPIGTNARTYTLTSADTGLRLRVKVTATNGGGQGSAGSSPTVRVGQPVASAPAVISGTPTAGQLLTTTTGTWTPYVTSYAYEWRRCDRAGNYCTSVGTGLRSYRLVAADAGHRMRVRVTATNSGGSGLSVADPSAVIGAS